MLCFLARSPCHLTKIKRSGFAWGLGVQKLAKEAMHVGPSSLSNTIQSIALSTSNRNPFNSTGRQLDLRICCCCCCLTKDTSSLSLPFSSSTHPQHNTSTVHRHTHTLLLHLPHTITHNVSSSRQGPIKRDAGVPGARAAVSPGAANDCQPHRGVL